jgi:hypothetical protein
LEELSGVQSRQGRVKQEEIRTPDALPGELVKKMQRSLPTLQHLQDEWHLMSLEHPSDEVHIRRVVFYDSDEQRREGFYSLHTKDFLVLAVPHSTPSSIPPLPWVLIISSYRRGRRKNTRLAVEFFMCAEERKIGNRFIA